MEYLSYLPAENINGVRQLAYYLKINLHPFFSLSVPMMPNSSESQQILAFPVYTVCHIISSSILTIMVVMSG